MEITLRKSIEADLEVFFLNQADEEANQMAAFTSLDPQDKEAYLTKWTKHLNDDRIHMQTILVDSKVIGTITKFVMDGKAEITYAISKEHWGKGLTTQAVINFLTIETTRPIYGHTAFDNIGSQRVLEKAGFIRIGEDKGFAKARGKVIHEFIYCLD